MIQKILMYAYIFLGIASFCYWVSAVLSFCRMTVNRIPGIGLSQLFSTRLLSSAIYTDEGNHQKQVFKSACLKLLLVLAAMALVVFIGIQTQRYQTQR